MKPQNLELLIDSLNTILTDDKLKDNKRLIRETTENIMILQEKYKRQTGSYYHPVKRS